MVTDPDGDITDITWQWASSDAKDGTFTPIEGAMSSMYTPEAADVNKYLRATASYTDAEGSGKSANETSANAVATANVGPEFATAMTNRTVAENTAAGEDIGNPVAANDANGDTLAYTLGGADAASFDIDGTTGQLMTLAALDYETKASYSVTVTASDSGDLSDSTAVTVTVTDVDEDGTASLSATQPQVGVELTAMVTDPDGDITDITWQWASSDAKDGTFTPIEGAMSSMYTPEAADVNKYLRATASYTDAEGSGKSANETSANAVATANVGPEFATAMTNRTVAENTAAGEDIGNPVAANDANGDTLAYTLGGADAASFDIDGTTGQLMTLAALDYETKASYSVTVTASDSGDLSDSTAVTVTVTDVDEGFEVSGPAAMDYAENGTAAVATYSATDPESATITWSLEGDDAALFDLSSGGVLTFGSPPDYENTADADQDNVYEVTVVASDATNDGGLDVTVTVTDVVDEDVAPADPVGRYDKNNNGRIDKEELVDGVFDYNVEQTLSKDELVELIFSYEIG